MPTFDFQFPADNAALRREEGRKEDTAAAHHSWEPVRNTPTGGDMKQRIKARYWTPEGFTPTAEIIIEGAGEQLDPSAAIKTYIPYDGAYARTFSRQPGTWSLAATNAFPICTAAGGETLLISRQLRQVTSLEQIQRDVLAAGGNWERVPFTFSALPQNPRVTSHSKKKAARPVTPESCPRTHALKAGDTVMRVDVSVLSGEPVWRAQTMTVKAAGPTSIRTTSGLVSRESLEDPEPTVNWGHAAFRYSVMDTLARDMEGMLPALRRGLRGKADALVTEAEALRRCADTLNSVPTAEALLAGADARRAGQGQDRAKTKKGGD